MKPKIYIQRLACALLVQNFCFVLPALTPEYALALSHYEQNFESLSPSDPLALANDGWKVFRCVYDDELLSFCGGPFDAPNNMTPPMSGNYSNIKTGEQSSGQGTQYLEVLNDYLLDDHNFPNHQIEADVFLQQTINSSDIGTVYRFQFDAKQSQAAPLGSNTTVAAFIRTFDPSNGFSQTHYLDVDNGDLSDTTWETRHIDFAVSDPNLAGQLLQFGMTNTAESFQNSSVYYDNVSFSALKITVPALPLYALIALAIGISGIRQRASLSRTDTIYTRL